MKTPLTLLTCAGFVLISVIQLGAAAPLISNLSSRSTLKGADDALIMGFVVTTPDTKVLLRAIGPALANFGVANPLADPVLVLYDSSGEVVVRGTTYKQPPGIPFDPLGEIAAARLQVGAFRVDTFPFTALDQVVLIGSLYRKDSGLAPGVYTMHVTSESDGTGSVLGEIYILEDESEQPLDAPSSASSSP